MFSRTGCKIDVVSTRDSFEKLECFLRSEMLVCFLQTECLQTQNELDSFQNKYQCRAVSTSLTVDQPFSI